MAKIAFPAPSLWTLDSGMEALDFGLRLAYLKLPPAMTSDEAPAPYTAAANAFMVNLPAYLAFDGDKTSPGSAWHSGSGSGWLLIRLGLPHIIRRYAITSQNASGCENRAPKNWTFQGSNNGVNWTTLDTRSNVTGWAVGETKAYNIASPASYFFYRLNVSADNGANLLSIEELELFTTTTSSTTMFSAASPVAESPWFAIDQNTLDATTPISIPENKLAALLGIASGNLRYQYALNNGAYNGSWLTQSQLQSAIFGQAITDRTYSMRLKVQFNSDGSQAADISGFGAKAEASGISNVYFELPLEVVEINELEVVEL